MSASVPVQRWSVTTDAPSELSPSQPVVIEPFDAAIVAEALFASGCVSSAVAVAHVSGDALLRQRVVTWRERIAVDALMAESISRGDGIIVPSVVLCPSGAPRFVVAPADGATAADVITREHGMHGVDPELRLFLDLALQDGDQFVDAAPGCGFAALSAASGGANVSVMVVCDEASSYPALQRSVRLSRLEAAVTIHAAGGMAQVATSPSAAGGHTLIHAGGAAAVPSMLAELRPAFERRRIGAVAWRCGRSGEQGRDAEALQIAAAVLSVFGFEHFALADGPNGPHLVPAELMASNEMIFSLSASFCARLAA